MLARHARRSLSANGRPSTSNRPAVGANKPTAMSASVVLPAPDGPTSAVVCWAAMAKETSWRTGVSP